MDALRETLKPFLWLAAIAFVVGFMSYLAMGHPAVAREEAARSLYTAPAAVSGPSADEWNLPKHI
jgi:hypothetical protein